MALVSLPKELKDVEFVTSEMGFPELPEDATDEQKKAYEAHREKLKTVNAQRYIEE